MAHFTSYKTAAQAGEIGDTTLVPFEGDNVWTIVAVSLDANDRKVITRNAAGRQRMELYATGGYNGGYVGSQYTARVILGSDEERQSLRLTPWHVAAEEEAATDPEWWARQERIRARAQAR